MSSPVRPEHVPPFIRILRDFLTEHTSVEPTVVRRGIHLVLEHENDRVRMTCTYRLFRGQWVQSATSLEIDGQRRNIASSPEEYVQVFLGDAEPTGTTQTASALEYRGPAQVSHDTRFGNSQTLGNARNQ